MAKSRRKSNGCKRGTYKRKPMGKGWLTAQKERGKRPNLEPKNKDDDANASSNSSDSSED